MSRSRHSSRSRSHPWEVQNRPPKDAPWCWFTREMLESPAWRSLSNAAYKVIFRIAIEHMSHAGRENGNLIVTYEDFRSYGIRRSSISAAIREAETLGFIQVTERGRGGNAEFRRASKYALGTLPLSDGTLCGNIWRRFKTCEEAEAAIADAKSRP